MEHQIVELDVPTAGGRGRGPVVVAHQDGGHRRAEVVDRRGRRHIDDPLPGKVRIAPDRLVADHRPHGVAIEIEVDLDWDRMAGAVGPGEGLLGDLALQPVEEDRKAADRDIGWAFARSP